MRLSKRVKTAISTPEPEGLWLRIASAIVKGSGFQNCENRSNILRVKNEKKEKGFDNSSQHLKTMLRGVYIQNILLTNAV